MTQSSIQQAIINLLFKERNELIKTFFQQTICQKRIALCTTPTYFTHQHSDVMKQLYIDIFMHKILGGYLPGSSGPFANKTKHELIVGAGRCAVIELLTCDTTRTRCHVDSKRFID